MKTLSVLMCGSLLLVAGCSSLPKDGTMHTITKDLPLPEPKWIPFNVPLASVSLPAFMVGESKQLSSGCWKSATASETESMGGFDWERDQKKEFDASLQASFKEYLVKAGLDASIADQFTQHWTLKGKTFSLVQVDPSRIRPEFSNQACTATDLNWFVDGRPVVTQAIKAGEIAIEAKMQMSNEQKAQLDAAIDKIGSELHADFHHLEDQGGTLKIDATNVFVGGMATGLKVKECKNTASFGATADAPFKICGYTIKLTPSAVGTRYTLSVTPQDGATAELDAELGKQTPFPVGDLRVVRALVEKDGQNFRVENFSVLLVGAGG